MDTVAAICNTHTRLKTNAREFSLLSFFFFSATIVSSRVPARGLRGDSEPSMSISSRPPATALARSTSVTAGHGSPRPDRAGSPPDEVRSSDRTPARCPDDRGRSASTARSSSRACCDGSEHRACAHCADPQVLNPAAARRSHVASYISASSRSSARADRSGGEHAVSGVPCSYISP